ncbi:hypothetical protein [Prosthecomicrobium sp. N25]|uniref:hypothetical protein n=1 Tax=Prosthecomicrobium sp. N25 TaxID=3129254 RepID=UPI003FCD700A
MRSRRAAMTGERRSEERRGNADRAGRGAGRLSADPAILALGVGFRADGASKDSGANIRATGAFTVHIVSDAVGRMGGP